MNDRRRYRRVSKFDKRVVGIFFVTEVFCALIDVKLKLTARKKSMIADINDGRGDAYFYNIVVFAERASIGIPL